LNPEDITKKESTKRKGSAWNEKDFKEVKTGADLDVPGELDNQQENVGSEEENNYYSIGGDNHNNLDEDNNIYKIKQV
jgi:hypothetical protein